MVMNEIEATASRLGVDLSTIDLDSIRLPPGDDFGILRFSAAFFFFFLALSLTYVFFNTEIDW